MISDVLPGYDYNGHGFESGEQSLTGQFSHVFVGLGQHYYTSDNVILNNAVRLGGSVTVQMPTEQTHKIQVMAGDIAAEHQPAAGEDIGTFFVHTNGF